MSEPVLPKMEWYIVKVQTNRETSVKDSLLRVIKREGMEEYFGQVVVPTEKVAEKTGTRTRVREEKIFPGYILLEMRLTDDSWYLVRHVNGVGDFAGAGGVPTPLAQQDVEALLSRIEAAPNKNQVVAAAKFSSGERVRIKSGAFEGFEGEVDSTNPQTGEVAVLIEIFGRPTPISVAPNEVDKI